ncbi:MAG: D-hexose-6-phosphate mutarotase [Kiritimatiellia bacterium]
MAAPRNADCGALNRDFGAPGRIVFRPSRHDAPIVVLANQYGAAEVALFGAQTISYRPTGNQPVLFMPRPYDAHAAGDEIHGGIPVCWPWFARNGPVGSKPHGVARYARWSVKSTEYDEDVTEITLTLASDDETRAVWPHDFALELKISVSMKLTLALHATNTGSKAFSVTEGFHPYFLVRERDRTEVLGVDGCDFTDTREPEKGTRTWTGACAVRCGGSKIFDVAKYEYVLMDHGLNRAIAVVSRGNRRLVVWNPGEESAGRVAEFGADGWRKFVCVEPCSTPQDVAYVLEPGASHDLLMAVQSVPDDGSVHARHA